MQVPYTTQTGVRIGSRYEAPRRIDSTSDCTNIQSAFLGSGIPIRRSRSHIKSMAIYMAAVAILAATALIHYGAI